MQDEVRPLSPILRSAGDVIDAVRARKDRLRLSDELVGEIAGFCPGTLGKYLGPSRLKSPTIGTLCLILQALGVGLMLVEDDDATARVSRLWARRQEHHIQSAGRLASIAVKRAAAIEKLASSGGKARWKGVDAAERRRQMRKLARKRWAA